LTNLDATVGSSPWMRSALHSGLARLLPNRSVSRGFLLSRALQNLQLMPQDDVLATSLGRVLTIA
jgi:hypothetical protein